MNVTYLNHFIYTSLTCILPWQRWHCWVAVPKSVRLLQLLLVLLLHIRDLRLRPAGTWYAIKASAAKSQPPQAPAPPVQLPWNHYLDSRHQTLYTGHAL